MRMGTVHLTVADLGRSLAYYEQAIGLRVHEHDGNQDAGRPAAANTTIEMAAGVKSERD